MALKTDDLGYSNLMPHRIILTPNAVPIKQKPYMLSKAQMEALKKQLIN